ncbi:MAG: HlyD family efflux transporter periplasmic adaptor subunit [Thermincola sp.]|jgi:putative membrane fusion protein|nr:HlyD family efflux transporter periplasmic adaptor subunit [Thermincola sp.]MDT3704073.1 HlyD family efflux transporter periplasmic adaptor subunit [Thermincola sp.]
MYKRSDAEIKVRVRRNPRKALRKLILFVIAFYVVFMTYGFIRDMAVDHLAGAQQVKPGVIEIKVPAKGILVRDELVVNAPRNGVLRVLAQDGERVRVGAVLAQVVVPSLESKVGETVFNIVTPRAGVVSYHLDGLENVYSPKNLTELDLNKIDTIKSEARNFTPGSQVEEGQPVCKIVNNLVPINILAVTDKVLDIPEKFAKSKINISLNDDRQVYQAALTEKAFRGKANQTLFSLENYDNSLMTAREQDFTVTTARYEGYIVPAGAIVQKEGQDGIYTIYKERVKWKEVKIEGSSQGQVVISGVTPETRVIFNPEYVSEGRPFRG